MKKKSIIKLLGVILLTCAGLAHANLLTNPSFEIEGLGGSGDAAGWFQTATHVQRVTDAGAVDGDYIMQIGDSDNGYHWASQNVAVTPGIEYTASTSVKAYMPSGPNGDDDIAFIYMEFFDAGAASLGATFTTYKNSDSDYGDFVWTTRSLIATAPAGAAEVSLRVMGYMPNNDGDSAIWFDEVSVIPEPATLGLLGLMGGGLLFVRKYFHA